MQTFRLTERELQPGCHVIEVEGELDLAVAGQLQEALDRAAAEHERILIGLGACEFIDSTGIATILRTYNQMSEEGHRLALYGASKQVDRILSITGLTSNGLVFETADQALSAFAEVS